jgi:hypothetical protein
MRLAVLYLSDQLGCGNEKRIRRRESFTTRTCRREDDPVNIKRRDALMKHQ